MEGLDRADLTRALRKLRATQPQQDSAAPQTAQPRACACCGQQLVLRCPDPQCPKAGVGGDAGAAVADAWQREE